MGTAQSVVRREYLLPPAYEVWGKVMFSQVSVCSQWSLLSHNVIGRQPRLRRQLPSEGTQKGRTPSRQTPHPHTPQDTDTARGYGQQAGSTHPTGMHTCLCNARV